MPRKSDFDIGNATLEDVARKYLSTRYPKRNVDSYIENPDPFSRFASQIGAGYEGLWSISIERMVKNTYDFYRIFVKPKETASFSNIMNPLKHILRPKSRFEGMEKKGFKTSEVFNRFLNFAVAEEVSHSLGFENDRKGKYKDYKFFIDFVEV